MAAFRYQQFCPLARAAEIVGERWTLLIVRDLLLGPKRFSDLKRTLSGVSTSVLADRLVRLEARGLVTRCELPPPAPAAVYELTEGGRDLLPVVIELSRWGARFLEGPAPGEHFEVEWVQLGLMSFARREATPWRCFNVTAQGADRDVSFLVRGGPDGTAVEPETGDADASIQAPAFALMGLASGGLDPLEAVRSGAIRVEGNVDALVDFPALFEMQTPRSQGD